MKIRPLAMEDLAGISAIQAASPEAVSWAPASYLEHDGLVAVRDGKVVGFLIARQVAPGECEVLNLAVDPPQRRTGIARALLKRALADRPGSWFLEVRASNAAAIQLYESIGFQAVGRRSNYYWDPSEDAIVMRFFS